MNRQFAALASAAVIAVLAAGCSSSSSSTAAKPSTTTRPAVTHPATVSGTETFKARETGQAVVSNNGPTYHLTFTGPVNTTGTFTPPNSNAVHQTGVFHTGAGNLAVNAVVSGGGDNVPPKPLGHCLYQINIRATYTVDGAKSTDRFAGATGHGVAVVVSEFRLPKNRNGSCNLSRSTKPLAKGAFSTFVGTGPLTIRQ